MALGDYQPDSAPVSFGGYQLLKRLAVGGMAEIFLASEVGGPADELIVVKRLLPHVSQHPDLVQMFLDEARVAATLDHPRIVKIYNVGAVDDQYFLSMEYLRGVDLANMCNKLWRQGRTLPLELSLYIIASVANALVYAHTKRGANGKSLGIVHRDVSPHNVFVAADGTVKLLDFGVAKAANALHHTKTGALVGKVAYMSPEQCRVEGIDARSDLFSLGVVNYELTTGRRLYNTKKLGDFEVLRRICEESVPRPSQVREDYPALVEQVVLRALAKDRSRRFQSAAEYERAVRTAARFMNLELSKERMGEFLQAEFPKTIEEAENNLKLLERAQFEHERSSGGLRRPGTSGSLPRLPGTSGSLPGGIEATPSGAKRMPSPSLPPTPASVAGFVQIEEEEEGGDAESYFDPDSDRTQPRRQAANSSVKWKQLPKVSVSPEVSSRRAGTEVFETRQFWLIGAIILLALVAGIVILVLT